MRSPKVSRIHPLGLENIYTKAMAKIIVVACDRKPTANLKQDNQSIC